MAIGEGEATGAIVIAGWQIHEMRGSGHISDFPTIIDTVRMFIVKYPQVHWRGPNDIRLFVVPEISGIPRRATGTIMIEAPFNEAIHRIAAHAHAPSARPLRRAQIFISWAVIDTNRACGVRAE